MNDTVYSTATSVDLPEAVQDRYGDVWFLGENGLYFGRSFASVATCYGPLYPADLSDPDATIPVPGETRTPAGRNSILPPVVRDGDGITWERELDWRYWPNLRGDETPEDLPNPIAGPEDLETLWSRRGPVTTYSHRTVRGALG